MPDLSPVILPCPCSLLLCNWFSVQRSDLVSLPRLCTKSNLHLTHKALFISFANTAVGCSVHKHLAGWMGVWWRQRDEYLRYVIATAPAITMGSNWQMCVLFRHMLLSHFLRLSRFHFSSQLQWIMMPSGSREKTTGEKFSSHSSFRHCSATFRLQTRVLKVLETLTEGQRLRQQAGTTQRLLLHADLSVYVQRGSVLSCTVHLSERSYVKIWKMHRDVAWVELR